MGQSDGGDVLWQFETVGSAPEERWDRRTAVMDWREAAGGHRAELLAPRVVCYGEVSCSALLDVQERARAVTEP